MVLLGVRHCEMSTINRMHSSTESIPSLELNLVVYQEATTINLTPGAHALFCTEPISATKRVCVDRRIATHAMEAREKDRR